MVKSEQTKAVIHYSYLVNYFLHYILIPFLSTKRKMMGTILLNFSRGEINISREGSLGHKPML